MGRISPLLNIYDLLEAQTNFASSLLSMSRHVHDSVTPSLCSIRTKSNLGTILTLGLPPITTATVHAAKNSQEFPFVNRDSFNYLLPAGILELSQRTVKELISKTLYP